MTAPTIARIGWRNLWRNPRRTALSIAAVGLSIALVLIYDGVLRWESDWLLETITGPMIGHVQLHAPDWRRTHGMDRTLRGVSSVLETLRRDPAVAGAAARVYAPALAASGEEGFGVIMLGVDLDQEMRPSRLLAGTTVKPSSRQVLVGRQLAEQMNLKAGATVAIVGQSVDGSIANDLVTVAALVETPVDLVNRQAIVMPIEDAQSLFGMPDEAHEIVVYARDPARAAALAASWRARPPGPGIEALDWQALVPSMVDLIRLVEAAWMFVLILVLMAAVAGVANTMLMATFERTHEFGMLLALGTAPSRIVAMVLFESVALSAAGALAGAIIGGALVEWAHGTGVDYAALTGGGPSQLQAFGMNWTLRVYPRLTWVDFARATTALFVTSIVASIWPALRAARLQPAQALRE